MKRILIAILAIALFGAAPVYAEVSAEAGADFVSKYVWRGFLLSDGANAQPWVDINITEGFHVGYWGSVNLEEDDSNSEQDFYAGYDFDLGLDGEYSVSLGYTYYSFPTVGGVSTDLESHEFWLGFTANNIILTPSLTLYIDVGDEVDGGGEGEYWLASVSRDIELQEELTMTLGADLGYNNKLFIEENGFADFTPSVVLAWEFSEHFTGGITLAYTLLVDSDVEDAMAGDDEFWGGINFSVS
jgi:uncharacterized protein (TIGR02001 family)